MQRQFNISGKKKSTKMFAIFLATLVVISSCIYWYKASNDNARAVYDCEVVNAPLPSWLQKAVSDNKFFYATVSSQTGVPWELLAAIHYRETSFSHTNPSNGQGIFQFVNGAGGPYPAGSVSDDEFVRQLKFMAQKIQSDYVYRSGLSYAKRPLTQNESEASRIQDVLFSYNGRSSQYANEAAKYGFSSSVQPYEGSPYVMNMFDCARARMGLITQDYGPVDGVDTRYGAFTLFARLKGDAYWQSVSAEQGLPACNVLIDKTTCVWSLTKPNGTSFYTPSITERNRLLAAGWGLESLEFYARTTPEPGTYPIHRLYNSSTGDHMWTVSAEESESLKRRGYNYEGITWYVDPPSVNTGYQVYRLYNPKNGDHAYTIDTKERDARVRKGYSLESAPFLAASRFAAAAVPPDGMYNAYRMYNPNSSKHLWTAGIRERDSLIAAGFNYEGVGFLSNSDSSGVAVYRLYSEPQQKHFLTTSAGEKDRLLAGGYRYEGIAFYAPESGTPIYRLYSPNLGDHMLTMGAGERDRLTSQGYISEGVGWYSR